MGFSKGQQVFVANGAPTPAAGQYGVVVNADDQSEIGVRFINGSTLNIDASNLQTEQTTTGHWNPPAAIKELSAELSGTTAGHAAA